MTDELLSVIIGLAVTVLPVVACAWWGVRRARRLRELERRREAYQRRSRYLTAVITADVSGFIEAMRKVGVSMEQASDGMRRLGEAWRRADKGEAS